MVDRDQKSRIRVHETVNICICKIDTCNINIFDGRDGRERPGGETDQKQKTKKF